MQHITTRYIIHYLFNQSLLHNYVLTLTKPVLIIWYYLFIYYQQDLPQAALPVLFLLTGRFLGFSPRRGDTLHHHGEIWHGGADLRSAPPCQISPWSVQGWGFTAPKTEKNSKLTNIIATKGRVPCTIFTKFISFMRVVSLHNSAKFGCFISINDKIINNLLRLGRFQPNFRRPLAEKLWMGPKIWWKSLDARRSERMKCDVFSLFFITGRICRRQLCRYFVYSRADFGVFRPAGATRCTDQGEIWHGAKF